MLCFSRAILVHLALPESLRWSRLSRIINLGSIIISFFPQSALISRATQEIKSPPFSQLSTPSLVPSPFYSFFSSPLQFTLSIFFLQVFFLSCFPAAPPHPLPNATNTPNAEPRFLCCVSSGGRRCLRLARCDTGSDEVKGQLSRDTPLILSARLSCDWGGG